MSVVRGAVQYIPNRFFRQIYFAKAYDLFLMNKALQRGMRIRYN